MILVLKYMTLTKCTYIRTNFTFQQNSKLLEKYEISSSLSRKRSSEQLRKNYVEFVNRLVYFIARRKDRTRDSPA